MKLHDRIEAIRAKQARLASSAAVPDKSAPAFGTDETGVLLDVIDRLTAQVAALASLADRRGQALARADAAEFVERIERAHDLIRERVRDAEDRGERLEEVEWLDRLDTLLAGAETARYGERRWRDRAWREGVERAIGEVERHRDAARAAEPQVPSAAIRRHALDGALLSLRALLGGDRARAPSKEGA